MQIDSMSYSLIKVGPEISFSSKADFRIIVLKGMMLIQEHIGI